MRKWLVLAAVFLVFVCCEPAVSERRQHSLAWSRCILTHTKTARKFQRKCGITSRVDVPASRSHDSWLQKRMAKWGRVRGSKQDRILADELGVKLPLSAPKWVWKFAWLVFNKFLLKMFHFLDPFAPSDTFVNLNVLWLKAIAGNSRDRHMSDGGLSFDMLPPFSRNVVRWPLCTLFPPLLHQNIALRNKFLDSASQEQINLHSAQGKRVIVVHLGSGFDTRSFRLRNATSHIEIDLPSVCEQKQRLLQHRLLPRRPHLASSLPTVLPTDLNDVDASLAALQETLSSLRSAPLASSLPPPGALNPASDQHAPPSSTPQEKPSNLAQQEETGAPPSLHILLVSEAVLLYLKEGKAEDLILSCARLAAHNHASFSFCFSDRIPVARCTPVPGALRASIRKRTREQHLQRAAKHSKNSRVGGAAEDEAAQVLLAQAGLELEAWFKRQSLTRHLGVAVARQRPAA